MARPTDSRGSGELNLEIHGGLAAATGTSSREDDTPLEQPPVAGNFLPRKISYMHASGFKSFRLPCPHAQSAWSAARIFASLGDICINGPVAFVPSLEVPNDDHAG